MKSLSVVTYCICFFVASSCVSAACLTGVFGNSTWLAGLPIAYGFNDYSTALNTFTNTMSNYDNMASGLAAALMSGEIVNLFLSFFGLIFKFVSFIPDLFTLWGIPEWLTGGITAILLVCLGIGVFGLITNRQVRYYD